MKKHAYLVLGLALASLSAVFLASCSSSPMSTEAPPTPTREALYEGSWVPVKREFPPNDAVSPCQNFYEYACSKALSTFKLRDDRSSHAFAFSDSSERLLTAKRNFLNHLARTEPRQERARTLRNNFTACMNESTSAQEERELVKRELGLVSAMKTPADWLKFLDERMDLPEPGLLGYDASIPNQGNPKRRDLTFLPSLMRLPDRSYYEKPEVLAELAALYAELFRTVGLESPETRAIAVVDLEKRFAMVYPLPVQIRDRLSTNTYVTRTALLKRYPNLPLTRFLKRVPETTRIRELAPEAMKFLNDAAAKEPLQVLKDAWLAHALPTYMDDAFPGYFAKDFDFNHKHLGGAKIRPVREERCAKQVMADFGRELDAELLPILFPDFPEKKIVELGERIRAALISELKQNVWLTSGARKMAIAKMASANLMLFKPATDDEWDFTPPAEYSAIHRYQNARTLRKNLIEKELKELGEDRNRRRWEMGPLEVNAYYMPSDNTFVLPAGILQYPFFDPQSPDEANLAAIGSCIGHELGHGIDDKGSKYDEKGLLRQWMSARDLREFGTRGARFIPRFEKLGHNGKLTLGENIGDHVGIISAYSAAFSGGAAASLEAKRAFFLQYARSWCYEARPSLKAMLLKTDPHSLGEARVNEQVLHLPGFYEAYGCKAGDPLYLPPAERIRVW